MNKTLKLFNKIISEESETNDQIQEKNTNINNQKIIDGDKNKPNVIQEDDLFDENENENNKNDNEIREKAKDIEDKLSTDSSETEFIENLIKATELQAVNIAIKSFIEDVKSKLGTNSETCVTIAQNKLTEVETDFKNIINKIKENREKIMKEAEQAKNKENLISIFDKVVDVTEDNNVQDDKNIIIDKIQRHK